jgi:UDP-2-acetamido-3-amino-2,3-dideoxy-glucuronate N-acetyltransferase
MDFAPSMVNLISKDASIHSSSRVWAFSQIREGAVIGENVTISSHVYVGAGVSIGKNSKIQNNAMLFEPAEIGEGVFIGPGVILTNDKYPRAVNPDGSQKSLADWSAVGVHVKEGASIGAGSVCVAPITIGKWAVVAAGSVVVRDVKDYSLVAGTPALPIGWIGSLGVRLRELSESEFECPLSRQRYLLSSDGNLERQD